MERASRRVPLPILLTRHEDCCAAALLRRYLYLRLARPRVWWNGEGERIVAARVGDTLAVVQRRRRPTWPVDKDTDGVVGDGRHDYDRCGLATYPRGRRCAGSCRTLVASSAATIGGAARSGGP